MSERPAFRALTVGAPAATLLGKATIGQIAVAAVFGSAFYLRMAGELLCVTTSDVEDGPISVRTDATCDWRQIGLQAGRSAHLTPQRLRVAGLIDIDLRVAPVWTPTPCAVTAAPECVSTGLRRLRAHLENRDEVAGLGAFLTPGFRPSPQDIHLDHAAPLIAAACGWLNSAARKGPSSSARWAVSLLGAGPGLTPSGDDFLGGVLIALHAIGRPDTATALWQQIAPHLSERTNEVSAALLTAAATGLGGRAVHQAIAALTGADPAALSPALAAIVRIGHSSGWDTLLGVVSVLDTLAATAERRAA